MGLGIRKIKINMRGTGGGRWMPRARAKAVANKARRAQSMPEADLELQQLCERCLDDVCGMGLQYGADRICADDTDDHFDHNESLAALIKRVAEEDSALLHELAAKEQDENTKD